MIRSRNSVRGGGAKKKHGKKWRRRSGGELGGEKGVKAEDKKGRVRNRERKVRR